AIDGILARWLGQVSNWGKIIDPLSDKILSTALVVTFYRMDVISVWFLLVVVGRDLLISIFSTKMVKNFRFIQQSVLIGKIVTFMLFIFYLLILFRLTGFLEEDVIPKMEIVVVLFVVVSGMYYLALYIKKFGRHSIGNNE
ncbi:MAG: CDP-alcohol phosphatidyltransferase family protein, partial [Brevinematia bacterium]